MRLPVNESGDKTSSVPSPSPCQALTDFLMGLLDAVGTCLVALSTYIEKTRSGPKSTCGGKWRGGEIWDLFFLSMIRLKLWMFIVTGVTGVGNWNN